METQNQRLENRLAVQLGFLRFFFRNIHQDNKFGPKRLPPPPYLGKIYTLSSDL